MSPIASRAPYARKTSSLVSVAMSSSSSSMPHSTVRLATVWLARSSRRSSYRSRPTSSRPASLPAWGSRSYLPEPSISMPCNARPIMRSTWQRVRVGADLPTSTRRLAATSTSDPRSSRPFGMQSSTARSTAGDNRSSTSKPIRSPLSNCSLVGSETTAPIALRTSSCPWPRRPASSISSRCSSSTVSSTPTRLGARTRRCNRFRSR